MKDQKLNGGLWAPVIEDRLHELRGVRGHGEGLGAILVHFPERWLRGSTNTRLQKDITGHNLSADIKGWIFFYFYLSACPFL